MIQKGCRESDGQVRQGTVPPSVSVKTPVGAYGRVFYFMVKLFTPDLFDTALQAIQSERWEGQASPEVE